MRMDIRSHVLDTRDITPPQLQPAPQQRGLKRVRDGQFRVSTETPTWPQRTTQHCHYCCHPFDSVPLPLPIKHDAQKDVFYVRGVFCSWGCMKAYNNRHTGYLSGVVSNNITLLKKRLTGKLEPIKSAPPREMLACFGGKLSIDEFRSVSSSKTYYILPQNLIMSPPNLVEHEEKQYKHKEAPKDLNFDGVNTKNEVLRLKRTKPTTNNKNTLEKAMGISVMFG